MADSLHLHGLLPTRLLCPWDSPSKNTGVGFHSLLQRIFPTQGSNLHLSLASPALASGFFTTSTTWEAPSMHAMESKNISWVMNWYLLKEKCSSAAYATMCPGDNARRSTRRSTKKKKKNPEEHITDCVEIKRQRLNLLPGLRHAHKQERYHTQKYLWSKVHKMIHFTESGIYSKVPCWFKNVRGRGRPHVSKVECLSVRTGLNQSQFSLHSTYGT